MLYLERMDDAPIGSIAVEHQKARTAAIFKCATKDFQSGLAAADMSLLKLDILAHEGDEPISAGVAIAGAIGVSGGSAAQHDEVARAGARWFLSALKE